MNALHPLLAFTLFFDPLSGVFPGMDDYWLWLVVPLVIAISVVYKCTRIESLRRLPIEAAIMATQILIVMVLAAGALWVVSYSYVRIIAHWG